MFRKMIKTMVLVFAALPVLAAAQPTVLVESVAVPEGTPNVDVEVSLATTANQAAAQWRVYYDDSIMTPDISMTCPNPLVMGCSLGSDVMGTYVQFASGFFPAGGLPAFSGDINFDITGAPIAIYPLTLSGEAHAAAGGAPIPSVGSMSGQIDVQDVPAPVFQLTHDGGGAGSTIDFGVDNLPGAANLDVNATITNVGNDPQNNLDGSCDITNDAGGVFTSAPDPIPFDLAVGGMEGFSMNCSTDVAGVYMGTLTCTHDGASSPDIYTLLCEEAPTPTYSDATAMLPLTMSEAQGNADPSDQLAITNIGEPMSLLTGTCGLSGDSQIQFDGGGSAFSVIQGGSGVIGLTCSAAAEGMYSSTLTCTPDASATDTTPQVYPVTCDIGPPDPGTWGSTPVSGSTIDFTPVEPVVEGTDLNNAEQLLVRNAGDVGDANITYSCDITGGSTEISQNPSPSAGTLVAGAADTIINYSCDTAADGNYSATVSCTWQNVITGFQGSEDYTVDCDVRDPWADIEESPASGTAQSVELGPNEPASWDFDFDEMIAEGGEGTVTCLLNGDGAFTFDGASNGTVTSGGNFGVTVDFTDPGQGDTFNATLNCEIADNPDPGTPVTEDVSWPIEVRVIGRNATFQVTKDFDDNNPLGVDVALDCNTGLPLFQTGTVHDPQAPGLGLGDFTRVEFVVVDFVPGELDCEVYELEVPAGYAVTYDGSLGDDGVGIAGETATACTFDDVESADFNCEIDNDLQFVDLTVNKEWIDENEGFNLPTWVEIEVACFNLADVAPVGADLPHLCETSGDPDVCFRDYIDTDDPLEYDLFPHWDGTTYCRITEFERPGFEKDDSGCANVPFAPGVDGECTITNTRLYEGIPTLSQYGLLLMALMMLGVGLVGFRRYS